MSVYANSSEPANSSGPANAGPSAFSDVAGLSAAVSGASGVLVGDGSLSGVAAAQSGAAGTLTEAGTGEGSGTANAASGATGTLTGFGAMAGAAAASSGASGTPTGAGLLAGTAAATSGAAGKLGHARRRNGSAALLPPNSTPFELDLADASDFGAPLPVPIRELWDPWRCPMHLLPWLAWALSVDIWDDSWPEAKKRLVVATSLRRNARKGTAKSLYEYVDLAGGRVARVITPPSKMFLMPARTAAERLRFLDLMPQLRVFPFRDRGTAHGGAYTAGPAFRVADRDRMFLAEKPRPDPASPLAALPLDSLLLAEGEGALLDEETGAPLLQEEAPAWAADPRRWSDCFAYPSDAPLRFGRRTFYWDRGAEIEARRLERTRIAEDGKTAYDFETTFIPAKAPYTLFPSQPVRSGRLGGRIFLVPADAVSRTVSTRVERNYSDPGDDRLDLKAVPIGNGFDPVDIRPRLVAQRGTAAGGLFPGAKRSGLHCVGGQGAGLAGVGSMPPTTAGDRLFERLYLHDPERLPENRTRTTHLGHVRLGMPAYHAEVLIETPGKRSKWAAGEFVHGFHVASDAPRRVNRMADAVRLSKAARDKVLVDTKAHRAPLAGDRARAGGGLVVGDLVRR